MCQQISSAVARRLRIRSGGITISFRSVSVFYNETQFKSLITLIPHFVKTTVGLQRVLKAKIIEQQSVPAFWHTLLSVMWFMFMSHSL